MYMEHGCPQVHKQNLLSLKEKRGPDTIIVGDLNTPLSSTSRTSRQKKIKKDVIELNSNVNEMDLKDIYRGFHPATADYTFFSASHGTSSKIGHILGHKVNLNKYKKNHNSPLYPIKS
jgi:exonuclease III